MRDDSFRDGAYLAEFASAEELSVALRAFREKGYVRLETYSPIPIPGEVSHPRSRLPVVVFIIGLIGGILSYAIQWYANAYSYPLNIGGRPPHAVPAFIVSTFEGTVLVSALAAFIGFFFILRLPQPWHPVFEIEGFEGATVDRYWLAVDASDQQGTADLTMQELSALSPLRVLHLGPQP